MTIIFRNLLRRRVRTLLTIIGIGVGVTVIIALGALADGFKAGYGAMMRGSKADLVLSQPDTLDGAHADQLALAKSQLDAARVHADDVVSITFDALPEVVVNGKVFWVAKKSAEGSGVNYTAVIVLDSIPDGLRWGMTAFVDIEVSS